MKKRQKIRLMNRTSSESPDHIKRLLTNFNKPYRAQGNEPWYFDQGGQKRENEEKRSHMRLVIVPEALAIFAANTTRGRGEGGLMN